MCALVGGSINTEAAFNAQTRNPLNVFGSGTLVLANTKQGSTTCLSTNGGTTDTNVNNGCEALMNTTVRKPGDTAVGRVTLTNNGSINASALQLYSSACANANATGESFNGSGLMCGKLTLYIQKYTSATFATPQTCVYGGGTGTTCAHDNAAKTINNFVSTYTSGAPAGLGALASGASGYYEVGIGFPSNSDNTFQGRQASFDLTWVLVQ